MEDLDAQVEGTLAVREVEAAYLVVRSEDPEDWLARFEKGADFPAREWAENMARVYNRRLFRRFADPPTPPGTRPESASRCRPLAALNSRILPPPTRSE